MKRRLLIIAICLLLGAVVNVAVAWGCAVAVDQFKVMPVAGTDASAELAARWSRPGVTYVSMSWFSPVEVHSWTPSGVVPAWADFTPRISNQKVLVVSFGDGRGWPVVSMWSERVEQHLLPPSGAPVRTLLEGGIETTLSRLSRRQYSTPRILPLRPIWPAFAINTLFYATILWLLVPGPFALRRFLRVRRGLCPQCAYPMGESSVCTECGCGLRARTP